MLRWEGGQARGDVLWKRPPRPKVGIIPIVRRGDMRVYMSERRWRARRLEFGRGGWRMVSLMLMPEYLYGMFRRCGFTCECRELGALGLGCESTTTTCDEVRTR